MEHDPLSIWTTIFGTLLMWKLGALLLLQPAVSRSERHLAWWRFAPVLWPVIWPIWLSALWREQRDVPAYRNRSGAVDPAGIVRLVPDGCPYGSPIPGDGQLARCIKPSVH